MPGRLRGDHPAVHAWIMGPENLCPVLKKRRHPSMTWTVHFSCPRFCP